MAANSNSNLLVCCNILTRIETLLERGTRIQLSRETLESIGDYLTKAVKYIDSTQEIFTSQLIIFGKCIESIDSVTSSKGFVATNHDTKEYLTSKLCPTITEFKVNVGRFLTDREFSYTPAMDKVIKDVIDTCIDNGYYFGY